MKLPRGSRRRGGMASGCDDEENSVDPFRFYGGGGGEGDGFGFGKK